MKRVSVALGSIVQFMLAMLVVALVLNLQQVKTRCTDLESRVNALEKAAPAPPIKSFRPLNDAVIGLPPGIPNDLSRVRP